MRAWIRAVPIGKPALNTPSSPNAPLSVVGSDARERELCAIDAQDGHAASRVASNRRSLRQLDVEQRNAVDDRVVRLHDARQAQSVAQVLDDERRERDARPAGGQREAAGMDDLEHRPLRIQLAGRESGTPPTTPCFVTCRPPGRTLSGVTPRAPSASTSSVERWTGSCRRRVERKARRSPPARASACRRERSQQRQRRVEMYMEFLRESVLSAVRTLPHA